MKILLDINVVLDVLLDRPPWVASAREIWKAFDENRATGYLSAISLPTIFYIVRKAAGLDKACDAVDVCLDAFEICAVDARVLETARSITGSNF
jgi:predicted nucleic acid-binding protein